MSDICDSSMIDTPLCGPRDFFATLSNQDYGKFGTRNLDFRLADNEIRDFLLIQRIMQGNWCWELSLSCDS